MYSTEILKHFQKPQHVGSIENADGFGVGHGGAKCPEDLAHFWIRVEGNRLVEVKHRTRGCPVAIAASSATAVMATGKTVEEALQITEDKVAQVLGEMPERKLDSIVGPRALRAAIEDYLTKK
ncbi:MAG: iron-sulfur cluster assembly scaffold protein [Chloroflexi bacterium]|nr:iron-sulfur cluster assembly scaffold protein [Chloroflexota bacterium]